ncbi:MAG: tyrosine-type recombinase/integrase [Thaumarchaeota archaeon]|nr:tyrosine-type recombinase/integrase [Nitrososphaerota archaeon]
MMQIQAVEDKITRFLEKKFRTSRSFSTKNTYNSALKKFMRFLRIQYNLDISQILRKIEAKKTDPVEILDNFYSFLAEYKRENSDKIGYSNQTICDYIAVAKEFLNGEGCKIYNEDIKQRFKLPRKINVYEKGLSKDIINRIVRLANAKLAATVLIACSSGMRIGEIVQLRFSDINFTEPVTITIRAETTKTRETRITHISSEAASALKDYLSRKNRQMKNEDYVFLLQHEDRLRNLRDRLEKNEYGNNGLQKMDKKNISILESNLRNISKEERYAKSVLSTNHNLEKQLSNMIKNVTELDTKNENGRNSIHFHAFRAWFKTQVTDAHQSDFAEALMGHKSLKLVYYRQNEKTRAKTYLEIEHALTIADTEKSDQNYSDMQRDNQELRGIVDNLSRQLQNLERRIGV